MSLYRRFNIKTVEGVDDFRSMKETPDKALSALFRRRRAYAAALFLSTAVLCSWSLP